MKNTLLNESQNSVERCVKSSGSGVEMRPIVWSRLEGLGLSSLKDLVKNQEQVNIENINA